MKIVLVLGRTTDYLCAYFSCCSRSFSHMRLKHRALLRRAYWKYLATSIVNRLPWMARSMSWLWRLLWVKGEFSILQMRQGRSLDSSEDRYLRTGEFWERTWQRQRSSSDQRSCSDFQQLSPASSHKYSQKEEDQLRIILLSAMLMDLANSFLSCLMFFCIFFLKAGREGDLGKGAGLPPGLVVSIWRMLVRAQDDWNCKLEISTTSFSSLTCVLRCFEGSYSHKSITASFLLAWSLQVWFGWLATYWLLSEQPMLGQWPCFLSQRVSEKGVTLDSSR